MCCVVSAGEGDAGAGRRRWASSVRDWSHRRRAGRGWKVKYRSLEQRQDSVPDFDPVQAIGDPADGAGLAGYAYLYGRPDPARSAELVGAAVAERSPVVQYWAIRTVAV